MKLIYNETVTYIPECKPAKKSITLNNASIGDYDNMVKHYIRLKNLGLIDSVTEDVIDANHKQFVATRVIGEYNKTIDIFLNLID